MTNNINFNKFFDPSDETLNYFNNTINSIYENHEEKINHSFKETLKFIAMVLSHTFIYFPFYISQEKTNYPLKFRNCSNRILLTISKFTHFKGGIQHD